MRTLNLSEIRERMESSPKIQWYLQELKMITTDTSDPMHPRVRILEEDDKRSVNELRALIVMERWQYYNKVRTEKKFKKPESLREEPKSLLQEAGDRLRLLYRSKF
jgi:hypothetical protein